MTSSTYFSYCITVTNESLLYATKAYPKVEGAIRFIRLVQHRIAQGTLAASAISAVSRVPTELWELVKHTLVDGNWIGRNNWSELWDNEDGCMSCMDRLLDQYGTANTDAARVCRAILSKYGLCMPSTQFLQDAVEHSQTDSPFSPSSKPNSLVIIALPSPAPTDAEGGGDQPCYPTPFVSQDKYFNDTIWNVSFDLPAHADNRFRALARDFHLEVVDIHDGTLALAGTSAAKVGPETARQVEPVKSVRAIKPRWKLFTTVVCDW